VSYLQQGIVLRIPTAILSTGLTVLAFLSIAVGLETRWVQCAPKSGSKLMSFAQ
jgi:hypothetical protein